ncbi:TPA: DNA-binding domain-containing protein, partial [Escherichia coli]
EGLREGSLSVNSVDSNVHVVSGYVFLCAPGIFYRFLKESGSGQDRRYVQSLFERAGIHKVRSGERFFRPVFIVTQNIPDVTKWFRDIWLRAGFCTGILRFPETARLLFSGE